LFFAGGLSQLFFEGRKLQGLTGKFFFEPAIFGDGLAVGGRLPQIGFDIRLGNDRFDFNGQANGITRHGTAFVKDGDFHGVAGNQFNFILLKRHIADFGVAFNQNARFFRCLPYGIDPGALFRNGHRFSVAHEVFAGRNNFPHLCRCVIPSPKQSDDEQPNKQSDIIPACHTFASFFLP